MGLQKDRPISLQGLARQLAHTHTHRIQDDLSRASWTCPRFPSILVLLNAQHLHLRKDRAPDRPAPYSGEQCARHLRNDPREVEEPELGYPSSVPWLWVL